MHNISICIIIKNESRYLPEWLEYHKLIGVDHFYIYNNNNGADDMEDICTAYADDLTIIDWPRQEDQQRRAYRHYVQHYAADSHWSAFIDADEFIVYKGENNLLDYLNTHTRSNALLMEWVIFGTNGHLSSPDGLVIENYTMTHTVNPNPYWKTICRAINIDAQNISTPHHFPYLNHTPIEPPHAEILCLHHYILRSKQDVMNKVNRGDAWNAAKSARRKTNPQASVQAYLKKYDNTDLYDGYMLRFCATLKERLAARGLLK